MATGPGTRFRGAISLFSVNTLSLMPWRHSIFASPITGNNVFITGLLTSSVKNRALTPDQAAHRPRVSL